MKQFLFGFEAFLFGRVNRTKLNSMTRQPSRISKSGRNNRRDLMQMPVLAIKGKRAKWWKAHVVKQCSGQEIGSLL